jgi:hypothetical protein
VRLPFVSFRYTYSFLADGAVIISDSTLRFRARDEVESSLAGHGFRVKTNEKPPTGQAGSSCSSPSASAEPA